MKEHIPVERIDIVQLSKRLKSFEGKLSRENAIDLVKAAARANAEMDYVMALSAVVVAS